MDYAFQREVIADRCPLAVVRRRASLAELSKVIPESCGEVWNVLRELGAKGAGRHVAVYLDDKIDGQIDLEVGVEMAEPFAGHQQVVGSSIPVGAVAKTIHFGPYGKLPDAHVAVRNWCARHGHALAGPNWEIYGHWTAECTRDPSKIRTDVVYLLKTDEQ